MDSESKFYLAVTAVVSFSIVLIIGFIAVGSIWGANLDHDFDRTCITGGKSITYITIAGNENSHKVCK